MELVASGTIDDFTESVTEALRQKVADKVGVLLAKVELTVTSASVTLAFTVVFLQISNDLLSARLRVAALFLSIGMAFTCGYTASGICDGLA